MPTFSRTLEQSLHRTLALANERHHEYATLEHLLLALADDQDAAAVMQACNVNIDKLRRNMVTYVGSELENLVTDGSEQSKPTAGFQRVIQRAVNHVQSSGREEVTGAHVLVAIFAERESHAAYFLQEQEMTRYDAVNYINHGIAKRPGLGESSRSRGADEPPEGNDEAVSMRWINPPELGVPSGYSQVVEVRAERLIFIAGQTALGRDGKLVGGTDFAAQAEQVFRNLSIALQSVGCTASNLVKLTVFLRNMENLSAYREARNRFFATTTPPAAPAVTLVEVSKLYGSDFLIEIEAIAVI
jgi:enamine deaminase RidA (YjgF/YER057c/UK114 family)